MYEIILAVHSVVRWLVLIVGVVALAQNISGWLGNKTWTAKNRKINGAFIGMFHLQVLLGLLLYVGGFSPTMNRIFSNFGGAMKDAALRFWAVEHISMMLLAAIVAHVAHVISKRQDADVTRFKYASIGFILAFVLVLVAIPWPFREAVGRSLIPSF